MIGPIHLFLSTENGWGGGGLWEIGRRSGRLLVLGRSGRNDGRNLHTPSRLICIQRERPLPGGLAPSPSPPLPRRRRRPAFPRRRLVGKKRKEKKKEMRCGACTFWRFSFFFVAQPRRVLHLELECGSLGHQRIQGRSLKFASYFFCAHFIVATRLLPKSFRRPLQKRNIVYPFLF